MAKQASIGGSEIDPDYDYLAWTMRASFKAKGSHWMKKAWIESVTDQNYQEWVDWDPKAAYTQDCNAVNLFVQFVYGSPAGVGAGIEFHVTWCETFAPDKGPGNLFKNEWRKITGTKDMRAVAFTNLFKQPDSDPIATPLDASATWSGDFGCVTT